MIRVLGRVTVEAAGPQPDRSHRARLVEYAAYLALHPDPTWPEVDAALWPSRRREGNLNTRNTATSRLRRWLGRDESGPFLRLHGYELRGVRTDWHEFLALTGGHATASLAHISTSDLAHALELVRDQPFGHTHPERYGWADALRVQMCVRIWEVTQALIERPPYDRVSRHGMPEHLPQVPTPWNAYPLDSQWDPRTSVDRSGGPSSCPRPPRQPAHLQGSRP